MYLLPKPSLAPVPQHGCLLSSVIDGLCWGCDKTRGLTYGVIVRGEFTLKRDLCKQSQHPAGYIHWDMCSFSGINVSQSPWTTERSRRTNVQFVSFGKRLLTQPCLNKVADISSNCCFMAVPLWHLSNPSDLDLRELAVHEFVWVCIFFYTARLNMNMFQSTAKHRGETDREER